MERALIEEPLNQLQPLAPFDGGGVYCIYYTGSYELYAPIAGCPPRFPIYTGYATPRRAQAGRLLAPVDQPLLFNRLRDHARVLQQVKDLQLDDFSCQFLVVDDIWAPLAAELLIQHFRPVWNVVVGGFGNHEPGSGRNAQPRPVWDELPPGVPGRRGWGQHISPARRS